MTNWYKSTCVCSKCGVATDLQESCDLRQSKVMKDLHHAIKEMNDGPYKASYQQRIKKYKDEIMEGGHNLLYM